MHLLHHKRSKQLAIAGITPVIDSLVKTEMKAPGAGRKPSLEDPVSVTVDVEKPQIEALQEIANEREVSVAALIREAIKMHLRRRRRK